MFMNRLNHSYGYNSPPSFLSQSHEQMTSLAGQFINFGLMGNTVSDMIRIIELDGENGVLRPKTIAFFVFTGYIPRLSTTLHDFHHLEISVPP